MGFSNYHDVGQFHVKFGLPSAQHAGPTIPHLLTNEVFNYRFKFLIEEIDELWEAYDTGDLAGAADALIDLVYVAMGTAQMMDLPWPALWDEVQRANMAKVRATGANDPRAKRGSALDVVKPKGWRPPDIAAVLSEA